MSMDNYEDFRWYNEPVTEVQILFDKAIKRGNTEDVKLFLNQGADPNKLNYYDETSIHWASYGGNTEIVKLLLKNGADPNKANKDGTTPLHWVLRKYYDKPYVANSEIVKLLLENGVDPNNPDGLGEPPLHMILKHGNKEILELFLENGADPNKCDKLGRTPLLVASFYKTLERNPLLMASFHKNEEIQKLLEKYINHLKQTKNMIRIFRLIMNTKKTVLLETILVTIRPPQISIPKAFALLKFLKDKSTLKHSINVKNKFMYELSK